MSGGAYEYVMATYNETIESSGFNNLPDSKYYDKYTDAVTTACNGGICYGHALSETASWNGDYDMFMYESSTWLRRGGCYDTSGSSGIFSYRRDHGGAYKSMSFRVVLLGN